MGINNTIIVYASRHGTTERYAKSMLQLLNGNVDLCSLNERADSMPDMSFYDTVVIGGSIHYGKNSKFVVNYVKNNYDFLLTKRLGLFVTSYYDKEKALKQLGGAYPQELLDKAIVADYFDGELLFPQMNLFERIAAKVVLKTEEIQPIIDKGKIIDFTNKLNLHV